jgi:hypothetical protein
MFSQSDRTNTEVLMGFPTLKSHETPKCEPPGHLFRAGCSLPKALFTQEKGKLDRMIDLL